MQKSYVKHIVNSYFNMSQIDLIRRLVLLKKRLMKTK